MLEQYKAPDVCSLLAALITQMSDLDASVLT